MAATTRGRPWRQGQGRGHSAAARPARRKREKPTPPMVTANREWQHGEGRRRTRKANHSGDGDEESEAAISFREKPTMVAAKTRKGAFNGDQAGEEEEGKADDDHGDSFEREATWEREAAHKESRSWWRRREKGGSHLIQRETNHGGSEDKGAFSGGEDKGALSNGKDKEGSI